MRIGHGYDAHRLAEGRPLVLGGVTVPFDRGLLGHSDADVLLHALSDALLGAACLGDIGALFPDSDPATEGIDSRRILAACYDAVRAAGWRLVNADCTVLAQRPKLAPYLPAMREQIASVLAVPASSVSIKATTEERMGFTGAEQGIAAHAVVLLEAAD